MSWLLHLLLLPPTPLLRGLVPSLPLLSLSLSHSHFLDSWIHRAMPRPDDLHTRSVALVTRLAKSGVVLTCLVATVATTSFSSSTTSSLFRGPVFFVSFFFFLQDRSMDHPSIFHGATTNNLNHILLFFFGLLFATDSISDHPNKDIRHPMNNLLTSSSYSCWFQASGRHKTT